MLDCDGRGHGVVVKMCESCPAKRIGWEYVGASGGGAGSGSGASLGRILAAASRRRPSWAPEELLRHAVGRIRPHGVATLP